MRLPSSYSALCKELKLKKERAKKFKMCSSCYSLIDGKNKESCNNCNQKNNNSKSKSKKKILDAVVFDYKQQIINIISHKWADIQDFKESKRVNIVKIQLY
jgi:hypothetical protein